MDQGAETSFDAANNDRDPPVGRADAPGIPDQRPVGPEARFPPRGIGVLGTFSFCGGIVGNHGVHISRAHEKGKPGTPQGLIGSGMLPVRLGNNPYPETLGFQYPADQRRREGGVIRIGVPGNKDKIAGIPSPRCHIPAVNGEEVHPAAAYPWAAPLIALPRRRLLGVSLF